MIKLQLLIFAIKISPTPPETRREITQQTLESRSSVTVSLWKCLASEAHPSPYT